MRQLKRINLRTILSGFTVALGIFIFVILSGFGNGLQILLMNFLLMMRQMFLNFPGSTSKPYKGYKAKRRIELENKDIEDIGLISHYSSNILLKNFKRRICKV